MSNETIIIAIVSALIIFGATLFIMYVSDNEYLEAILETKRKRKEQKLSEQLGFFGTVKSETEYIRKEMYDNRSRIYDLAQKQQTQIDDLKDKVNAIKHTKRTKRGHKK